MPQLALFHCDDFTLFHHRGQEVFPLVLPETFESMVLGIYTIRAEGAGFKIFTSRMNTLTIGQPMTVNVTLQVGTFNEKVTVVATAEACRRAVREISAMKKTRLLSLNFPS